MSTESRQTYQAPIDVIPHRPPFLFLDEVTEFVAGESAKGLWKLREKADFFRGHFPGRPIVPGVLQVEALAQLGAYCLCSDPQFEGKLPLFGGIEKARFRKQLIPGDVAELSIALDAIGSRGGKGHGELTVNGQKAMQATLFFILVDA